MNKYIFTTALIGALFCNNVFAAPVQTWYNGNCEAGTYELGVTTDHAGTSDKCSSFPDSPSCYTNYGCIQCPEGYTSDAGAHWGCVDFSKESCIEGNMVTYDDVCYPIEQPETNASSGLANGATCDSDNLGTSTNGSTAQTEAIWNANTININWYNGDTRVAQNTCTYDGQITLPQQPTKVGYTFNGWKLKTN